MSSLTWSFSALKEYKTCARKYHANRVLKLYPAQETEATIYGKLVHTAAEEYIRDGKPLVGNMARFKKSLDALKSIPGRKLCELEMALKPDGTPCNFDDEGRWVRGIADLVILNGDKAFVCDYKTGSAKYPDKSQLELMALMLFAHYPEVTEVKAALLFVHHNKLVPALYKRENEQKMWANWRSDVDTLQSSYDNDMWHPNPNGLCRKWCNVEYCEYRG
jgi:hypothetical protein